MLFCDSGQHKNLIEFLACIDNPSMVELGVYKADTAIRILEAVPNLEYLGVDAYLPCPTMGDSIPQLTDAFNVANDRLKGFENACLFVGDTVEAAEFYPDRHFDVVFLDATHTYEAVKTELEAWYPKTDHVICGHDYLGVYIGVRQAVDEFAAEHNLKVEHDPQTNVWYIRIDKK